MKAPSAMEGETTLPTSAMQVISSDEVFMAPGWNDWIGVLERPRPLAPVLLNVSS